MFGAQFYGAHKALIPVIKDILTSGDLNFFSSARRVTRLVQLEFYMGYAVYLLQLIQYKCCMTTTLLLISLPKQQDMQPGHSEGRSVLYQY